MMWDFVSYSIRNLFSRKLRTFLTVLSILIGIAAIFALYAFGEGMTFYVNSLASEMGTDKVMAIGGTSFTSGINPDFFFDEQEIALLGKVRGVKEIAPLSVGGVEVKRDGQLKYVFGAAWDPGENRRLVEEVFTITILEGRALKKGDKFKVALGYNYGQENKIFNNPVKVGEKLEINGHKFDVVGIYEELGNPQDDSNIYFTFDAWDLLFPDQQGLYYEAVIRTEPDVVPAAVASRAKNRLRKYRDLAEGDENFEIQTFEQALETFTNILGVIQAIIILIALISLIVAGVNITNTMYTAVLERTKEIGIMKAVGAQNKDILLIMVLESGFLGMVGGAIGVFFGWILASIGGKIAAQSGYALLAPIFPLWLIIGCIGFGLVIGSVAGFFPARAASKMTPVDSLRYE